VAIAGYSIGGYWWLFYLMAIMTILLMGIGGYYINGYWWLLVAIGGYYINGYWWLFY